MRFFLYRRGAEWVDAVENLKRLQQHEEKWRLLSVGEMLLLDAVESNRLPISELPGLSAESVMQLTRQGECGGLEMSIEQWHQNGQQIFDVSPVSAMFLESDASQLPIALLKLPYDSFYLHWGKHLEIPSPLPGRFIEGCYVDNGKMPVDEMEDFETSFTFVCSDAADYQWDEHSLLANIVTDLSGVKGLYEGVDEYGTIEGTLRQFAEPGYATSEDVTRWGPFLPAALNMAANCLCFLASPKVDIQKQFPPEAPSRLTRQLNSVRPKEARRARSKLNAMGFRVIHLCGQQLAHRMGLTESSRTMPPHWRKGHWRTTRYGTGRAQLKVDWIHATVVNATQGSPKGGHLYVP